MGVGEVQSEYSVSGDLFCSQKVVTLSPDLLRQLHCVVVGCRGVFPQIFERQWQPGETCSFSQRPLYAITPPPGRRCKGIRLGVSKTENKRGKRGKTKRERNTN